MNCDICGSDEGVECEVLVKGDHVDRIYHLCPEHWVAVYRRTLDDFTENNEYKVNSYIKMVADKLIVDSLNRIKTETLVDEEGTLPIEEMGVKEVRRLRSYNPDGDEVDYE